MQKCKNAFAYCKQSKTGGGKARNEAIIYPSVWIFDIVLQHAEIKGNIIFYTDEDDLLDVTDYLFGLDKTHVYHLGLVLGLSHHRVKEMEGSKTFLDDMIVAWLQKVDQVQKRGVPTWQRLVEALKHDRVRQIGIASKIETEKLHNT